jgi:hypothetical protein
MIMMKRMFWFLLCQFCVVAVFSIVDKICLSIRDPGNGSIANKKTPPRGHAVPEMKTPKARSRCRCEKKSRERERENRKMIEGEKNQVSLCIK